MHSRNFGDKSKPVNFSHSLVKWTPLEEMLWHKNLRANFREPNLLEIYRQCHKVIGDLDIPQEGDNNSSPQNKEFIQSRNLSHLLDKYLPIY
jgi:hypothetical protein